MKFKLKPGTVIRSSKYGVITENNLTDELAVKLLQSSASFTNCFEHGEEVKPKKASGKKGGSKSK